ncbi:MAG: hypothetical protein GX237_07210 [Clostridiales bacterium]|nr:hypothetical protein [Clostridiales bacterium]
MNEIILEIENEDTITADEIRQILERYRIGKKPLAKLLGWGETTIIRYMDGDIPTSEYSSKLKMILDNPEFYYDLLIKRQDCLTDVAYRKSKKAVLSRIMVSRIYAAAYYIINKCDAETCASYIQYLLYYIQAFSLSLYDNEMFKEDYKVNNDLIPFPKIYNNMKKCGIHTLEVGDGFLNEEETDLIDAVCEGFSWYGPKALQSLMNYEASILKVSKDRFNSKIYSKEDIKSYFKDMCGTCKITGIEDIYKYPDYCLAKIRKQRYEK